MPEEQKPFIHQDGTYSPPAPTPAAELLATNALAAIVRAFRDGEEAIRGLALPSKDEDRELRILGRAIETVQILQEPRVNTTVGALILLGPSMQALVSDIAIALATDPNGQQNLANGLRKLIEGRS